MRRNIHKWLGIALSVLIVCSCNVSNTSTTINNSNQDPVNPEVDYTVTVETISGNGYVADNDKDTNLNPKILLKFSKEIDISNLSSGILLVSADNPNQKIDLTYNADGNNILVSPKLPLAISTDYILNITKNLKTLDAKKLIPEKSFKFSTGDDNKLIVSLISPMDILKNLESVKIQLYFSHPIVDFKELPADAIVITNSTERTDTVTIDSIQPDSSLDPHIINVFIKNKLKINSTYKIMITSKIHDAQNSPILNSEALHFKTRNSAMISCSFICTLKECNTGANNSMMLSFKPDIQIKCNFPEGATAVHPAAEELLKHISFTRVDDHDHDTNVNLYALQQQDQDGIYRFSSKDNLDSNMKYYLQILSFKISDDLMIVNGIANPFKILNSINTTSEGSHSHAVDMQIDNDEVFIFGNSKASYIGGQKKYHGVFIDKYNYSSELIKSIELNLENGASNSFLNLQSGVYKNNIVALLLQTDSDVDSLPGNVNNYVERVDISDTEASFKKLNSIKAIKSEKITTQKINSRSIDTVKDTTYVLSEIEFKNGSEPHFGCMVTFYADNYASPLSVIAIDQKNDGPDYKISCDKIIATKTLYDSAHNIAKQELVIAHHNRSYREFDVFTYYILNDESNPANSISLKSSKSFGSDRDYWDDMPLVMFYSNPTNKQSYVYMVAADKPDLKIYKCDLIADPVKSPYNNIIPCDNGYTIGSRSQGVSGYDHSVSSFSIDNDQHYLVNYGYNQRYYLEDVHFGSYISPPKSDNSQLVKYLHSNSGYNYILWNDDDHYQLLRV